jgi:hypothetical protein
MTERSEGTPEAAPLSGRTDPWGDYLAAAQAA